jgi:hypothetical protein
MLKVDCYHNQLNYLKKNELKLKLKLKKNKMKKLSGAEKVTMISALAKKTYQKGKEKWTDAIKRATRELKKANKI